MKQRTQSLKKALFLDRDGIINEDTGYPHKPEQIVFKDGIFSFCKKAVAKGYILVVITNQAGIAKGHFTEQDVRHLHDWMSNKFREQGITIAGFYYCPFHKDGVLSRYKKDSNHRKPKPGMIIKAADDLGIDVGNSKVVGDKLSDRIELEGLQSIIVKSTYVPDGFDAETLDEVLTML